MKVLIVCTLIAISCYSVSVPCTQYQASTLGNATDCSITRKDSVTIAWGATINFKANSKWTAKSYSNVLADFSSPRVPIGPSKSDCVSK